MSTLNALFNVLRGEEEKTVIDQTFRPYGVYKPTEGDIVSMIDDGGEAKIEVAEGVRLDDAASVAILAQRLVALPQMWVCVDTMQPGVGFDSHITGKVTCLRGTMLIRTEQFNTGETYAPGDSVTVVGGLCRANPVGGTEYRQQFGEVFKHDSVKNTLEVSIIS